MKAIIIISRDIRREKLRGKKTKRWKRKVHEST